jgi:Zn-finger nucleic acid-binding protein
MKCPLDRNDMIVVEHKKIELDYCLLCSGVWFDSGEMDLLLGTIGLPEGQPLSNLVAADKADATEAKRKCPVCGHKMDKVWLGKTPRVLIDSCPLGDGLWFDGGELHQVLKQTVPQGTSKDVVSFLGDAFPVDLNEGSKRAVKEGGF